MMKLLALTALVAAANADSEPIPVVNDPVPDMIESSPYFEGDMLLSEKQIREGYENGDDLLNSLIAEQSRGVVTAGDTEETEGRRLGAGLETRWLRVGGITTVPYVILSGFTSAEQTTIRNAMTRLANSVGTIRFVARTTERDYIGFVTGSGCSSFIGRRGGGQAVTLQNSGGGTCVTNGIVQHEVMHALGFYHEQSRPDRNSFVRINTQNIRAGTQNNFAISNRINSLGSAYDYGSVMHYGRTAFSVNGQDTITPLQSGVSIGQRVGASSRDIAQLRSMYPLNRAEMEAFQADEAAAAEGSSTLTSEPAPYLLGAGAAAVVGFTAFAVMSVVRKQRASAASESEINPKYGA